MQWPLAAYLIPAIVANPLQEGFGEVPSIKEHVLRAAAQAIAGIAEEFQRKFVLGGATFTPQPPPKRDAEAPLRPYQEDEGEAIPGPSHQAGKAPGEAFERRGKRSWETVSSASAKATHLAEVQ